ncbi:acetate--CoA ligase [Ranunculus cassubicifolius]
MLLEIQDVPYQIHGGKLRRGFLITLLQGTWPQKHVPATFPFSASRYVLVSKPHSTDMGYYGRDKDGYHWRTGRVDDVINASGHCIGTSRS